MAENPEKVVKVDMGCEIQGAGKLISGIRERGFAVELTQDGGLAVTPASKLQPNERELIRSNRAAIVDYLTAANDPQPDPDRHCYPHTEAANTAELATMTTRIATFARIGMDVDTSERMADMLLIRDREGDDRHLCLECSSLTGGTGNWRCMAFRQRVARDPGLPHDLVQVLTRCQSFVAGEPSTSSSYTTARSANETRLVHPGRAPGPWLTPSEKVASDAYHLHHGQCQQCQAAGRGYVSRCSAGAVLWDQYQEGVTQ